MSAPVELLVLGALRVLARRWTFDDLFEATFISAEIHRKFFHMFVERYAAEIYPIVCTYPVSAEEIESCMEDYRAAGFNGAIGSVDVTHIRWWKCSSNLKQLNRGKEGYATRAFQVTVNNKRKILAATKGFYGSCNDKTIVRFDDFVMKIHAGTLYSDIE